MPPAPRPASRRPALRHLTRIAAVCLLAGPGLLAGSGFLVGQVLLAGPALAQEESWTRHLPNIAPALRACLEGETAAAVTVALPMNHGKVLVRLAKPGGEMLECIAELGPPGQPAKRESRRAPGPVPPLPEEGDMLFTLDRRCAAAQPVRDSGEPVQGWLAPAGCG